MSRWYRGEVVAIQAHAYHRSPLDPLPAERISHRPLCFSSVFTACSQDSTMPLGSVIRKFFWTRNT
jgi:hypothetical protein